MLFQAEKLFQKEQHQAFISRMFRKIFIEDWLMKLVALVITLALWLGVSGLRAPTTARIRSVPLTLRVSNDVDVTNLPVQEVDIVVTGDKNKINQINKNDLVVSLDLTDVQAGDRTVQLTKDNVNIELPTNVKLEQIQPNKIAVRLERVEEREIPVKVETEGNLHEGFEIYGTSVSPQKVRVRGPESYIRALDSISTEKINIENRQNDFTMQQVSLNVVNPKVTLLDTVVDVEIRIGEKRAEKTYLIPVKTEQGDRTATIVIYGPPSILQNLHADQLQIELIRNEAGELAPRVILPPEVEGKVEVRRRRIDS